MATNTGQPDDRRMSRRSKQIGGGVAIAVVLIGMLRLSWHVMQLARPAACRGDFRHFNWDCTTYPGTNSRAMSAVTEILGPIGITIGSMFVLTLLVGLGLGIGWLFQPSAQSRASRPKPLRLWRHPIVWMRGWPQRRRDRREEHWARLVNS